MNALLLEWLFHGASKAYPDAILRHSNDFSYATILSESLQDPNHQSRTFNAVAIRNYEPVVICKVTKLVAHIIFYS